MKYEIYINDYFANNKTKKSQQSKYYAAKTVVKVDRVSETNNTIDIGRVANQKLMTCCVKKSKKHVL